MQLLLAEVVMWAGEKLMKHDGLYIYGNLSNNTIFTHARTVYETHARKHTNQRMIRWVRERCTEALSHMGTSFVSTDKSCLQSGTHKCWQKSVETTNRLVKLFHHNRMICTACVKVYTSRRKCTWTQTLHRMLLFASLHFVTKYPDFRG